MADELSCTFCGKFFRRESTLQVHNCEQKKRFFQKNDPGVQIGFQTYLRFFELTQGTSKLKTHEDFSTSPYYTAFVKFGKHIKKINAVAPALFIDWIIKQNKKLDKWCRDDMYEEFLHNYLRKEKAEEAIERFVEFTVEWGIENDAEFNHVFWLGNENKICYYITLGKISPWALYNCDTGIKFLEELNEEQVQYIFKWIDPSYWQRHFIDYMADTELIKKALSDGGF